MKNTNVSGKDRNLMSALETHFEGTINLAGVKFISLFVIALTKVRTVNFENLARGFDSDIIAKLIFNLLPDKNQLPLSIDRTNWKF